MLNMQVSYVHGCVATSAEVKSNLRNHDMGKLV